MYFSDSPLVIRFPFKVTNFNFYSKTKITFLNQQYHCFDCKKNLPLMYHKSFNMSHSCEDDMNNKRGLSFWILILVAVLLVLFLLVGQTFSLINYEVAVAYGLQESVQEVSEVGIAFAKGFAFADTVAYIPMFLLGIVGLLKGKKWGVYLMFAGCAISIYWPLVHLYAIYIGKDIIALDPEKYVSFPITLSLIIIYGIWGMWYLYKKQNL
jgi:hypothetical protein